MKVTKEMRARKAKKAVRARQSGFLGTKEATIPTMGTKVTKEMRATRASKVLRATETGFPDTKVVIIQNDGNEGNEGNEGSIESDGGIANLRFAE